MSNVQVTKDLANARLVVSSDFPVAPERVWQLWADPRQLERWWGPDLYPATVVDHDLQPGGRVTYFMTGPEGDRHHGYWKVIEVTPPHRLVLEDGFADESGNPVDAMPVSHTVVTVESIGEGVTRMTIEGVYDTAADLERVLAMGMEEGIRQAVGQIDALIAAG